MTVAAFPAVEPSSRVWTPGNFPLRSFNTLSGNETRILLGAKPVGASLSMTFNNLRESVISQITNHFYVAKGSYETFGLPSATFAGMSSSEGVTPSGFAWRYGAAPSVDWVAPGIGNVSVSLLAVPN